MKVLLIQCFFFEPEKLKTILFNSLEDFTEHMTKQRLSFGELKVIAEQPENYAESECFDLLVYGEFEDEWCKQEVYVITSGEATKGLVL